VVGLSPGGEKGEVLQKAILNTKVKRGGENGDRSLGGGKEGGKKKKNWRRFGGKRKKLQPWGVILPRGRKRKKGEKVKKKEEKRGRKETSLAGERGKDKK